MPVIVPSSGCLTPKEFSESFALIGMYSHLRLCKADIESMVKQYDNNSYVDYERVLRAFSIRPAPEKLPLTAAGVVGKTSFTTCVDGVMIHPQLAIVNEASMGHGEISSMCTDLYMEIGL